MTEVGHEAEHAGEPVCHARTAAEWRAWLEEHSGAASAVWLVMHHSSSPLTGLAMGDAVAQALCFGWVDSKQVKRDEHTSWQRFSPRNPKSYWSRINRARAEELIAAGLMRPAGQALVDLAKRTGTWNALEDAENGVVPDDLAAAFTAAGPEARRRFEAFPASVRREILTWIMTAKRPETRARRVAETAERAARGQRAR
jgi:uncharacterized protein YdeI (YjbR/CyaY-like superfamily)